MIYPQTDALESSFEGRTVHEHIILINNLGIVSLYIMTLGSSILSPIMRAPQFCWSRGARTHPIAITRGKHVIELVEILLHHTHKSVAGFFLSRLGSGSVHVTYFPSKPIHSVIP